MKNFLHIRMIQICICLTVLFSNFSLSQIVYTQDWESGIGSWFASNGVWEVGIPTVGPPSTHSGVNCAGTILGGNYPSYANTRLVSPLVTLPSGHVRLKFWHWYGMAGGDWGKVQVSTDNGVSWVTVSSPNFDHSSAAWTQCCVDLSAYAGTSVRIGFYFTSDLNYNDVGWYIDDVSVVAGAENFPNPEDFELGVGDWSADNGLWEVGIPTVGPTGTHSGVNCAGTILGGNYPSYANTRLVSPLVTLPSGHVRLKFWHWYGTSDANDYGKVEVSTNNGVSWITVSGPNFDQSSPAWTQSCVDLSAYAGTSVRIGFYFTSDLNYLGVGWYIDDVSIVAGAENFPNPEDFELGVGDWSADNGLWEVGIPTVGPPSTHSGVNCAGTVLGGNYPSYANTRLVSPQITLQGQQPELFFWHWYGMAGGDWGQVQISVNDGPWQIVPGFGGPYTGSNSTWSQGYVPLSAFVDSTIRISFYFSSDLNYNDVGWYIDDVFINGLIVPVELTFFTAKVAANEIQLEWQTSTETNNRGFDVERSTDNSDFQKIGFVEGNGTTTEKQEYSFIDIPDKSGKYYYRLKQIDFDGTFSYSKVVEVEYGIPTEYNLSQNFPNPFNPSTKISWQSPVASWQTLKIFDVLGNEVSTLVDEYKPAGSYEVEFDASSLSSGIYIYKLQSVDLSSGSGQGFSAIKKLVLLK